LYLPDVFYNWVRGMTGTDSSSRVETITAFLARVFPFGTIPFPRKSGNDPTAGMHYAFNYAEWKGGGKGGDPARGEALLKKLRAAGALTKPWPLWPPDMFGVVATLLEQSGTYLRMVELGDRKVAAAKPGSCAVCYDAKALVEATVTSQSLALDTQVLEVCRIIGGLWREGCLFISGDGGKPRIDPAGPEASFIVTSLQSNCRDALAELEDRFRPEFKDEGAVSRMCDAAIDCFLKAYFDNQGSSTKPAHVLRSRVLPGLDTLLLPCLLKARLLDKPVNGDSDYERRLEGVSPTCRFEVTLCLWAFAFIADLWNEIESNSRPYVLGRSHPDSLEPWQVAAVLLLAIADEAGRGIGFSGPKPIMRQHTALDESNRNKVAKSDAIGLTCRSLWEAHAGVLIRNNTYPRNLARCIDESVSTVMPKARVPAAGCTIRSLSHHLALLPPKGRIRTRWAQQKTVDEHPTFNLLLVPYPYEIRSSDVTPLAADLADRNKSWGRFNIDPDWLARDPGKPGLALTKVQTRNRMWQFVEALIGDQPEGVINGIVFPEGALTEDVLAAIAGKLARDQKYKSISMLTAGITDYDDKPGNYVATLLRDEGATAWHTIFVRSKHHRWSLGETQLTSYALSNRLPPNRVWWENIPLPPRELHFAEFSKGSVMTSLICEDLARIDPCQAALRAVGPNLTLVLLMDSAQITSRWPAQYAGVLADDPGTSVLTLTSYGLLRRSNLSDGHDSRAIALWREPYGGKARQIDLPQGYHAQLLSLRRTRHREVTLDGRGDASSAVVWKLAGIVPIRVAKNAHPPGYPADGF